jgi:hypothetical protein
MVKKLMIKNPKKCSDPKKSKISTKKIKEIGMSYKDMKRILLKVTKYLLQQTSTQDKELIITDFASLVTVGQLHDNLNRINYNTKRILSRFLSSNKLYLTDKQHNLHNLWRLDVLDHKGNWVDSFEHFKGNNNNYIYTETTKEVLQLNKDNSGIGNPVFFKNKQIYLLKTNINPDQYTQLADITPDQINKVVKPTNDIEKREIVDTAEAGFGCASRYEDRDEMNQGKSWLFAGSVKAIGYALRSKSKTMAIKLLSVATGTALAMLTEFLATGDMSPETLLSSTFINRNLTGWGPQVILRLAVTNLFNSTSTG